MGRDLYNASCGPLKQMRCEWLARILRLDYKQLHSKAKRCQTNYLGYVTDTVALSTPSEQDVVVIHMNKKVATLRPPQIETLAYIDDPTTIPYTTYMSFALKRIV